MKKVKRTKMKRAADFLRWEGLLCAESLRMLSQVERPARLAGKPLPADINGLTLEQLFRLWGIHSTQDLMLVGADVVLGLKPARVLKADTLSAVGFANWLAAELQRVSALWQDMPRSQSAEEITAGVNRLNFGFFGIADWYAKRMHITNHDEALATNWMRVYQCMRNDAEEAEYQKRLMRIKTAK